MPTPTGGLYLDPETGYYSEPPTKRARKANSTVPISPPMMLETAGAAAGPQQRKASKAAIAKLQPKGPPNMPATAHMGQAPVPLQFRYGLPPEHPAYLLREPPPKAKAEPKAKARAPTRRRGMCPWLCWWPFRLCKQLVPITFLAMVLSAIVVPEVGVGLGSILKGASDITSAAGQVAAAGANVSVAISHVAVASTKGTLGVLSEAWDGVDLLNLTISAEQGGVVIDDNLAFEKYLDSPAGHHVWRAPAAVREVALSVIAQASPHIPAQQLVRSFLNISDEYHQVRIAVKLDDEGFWHINWLFVEVGFAPRWSNPMWAIACMDWQTEESQIRERLDGIVSQQLHLLFKEARSGERIVTKRKTWMAAAQDAVRQLEPPMHRSGRDTSRR